MDNELVWLCQSMIKVEENYATEFYYFFYYGDIDHTGKHSEVKLSNGFFYVYNHLKVVTKTQF